MKKSSFGNVLIFGGSGVIGRSIAARFGQGGWTVGVHFHRHQTMAEATATRIHETGGHAHVIQADVREPSQIRLGVHRFTQTVGELDLLIWSVGTGPSSLVLQTSPDMWLHTLHLNLTGAFHVLQTAGPIFEQQHRGAVVLIGSLSGEQGRPGQAAYAASKAGLLGLMKTVAREWGQWNIRVNMVFPGWHPSPLTESGFDTALRQTPHVLTRTPSLEEVAQTVYHLATAKDVSGQVWNVDSRIW